MSQNLVLISGKCISPSTPIGSDSSLSHVQLAFPSRVTSSDLIKRQEQLLLEKAYFKTKKKKKRERELTQLTLQLFQSTLLLCHSTEEKNYICPLKSGEMDFAKDFHSVNNQTNLGSHWLFLNDLQDAAERRKPTVSKSNLTAWLCIVSGDIYWLTNRKRLKVLLWVNCFLGDSHVLNAVTHIFTLSF